MTTPDSQPPQTAPVPLRARLWTHVRTQRLAVVGLMVPALLVAWTVSRVLAVTPTPPLQIEGEQRYGMTPLRRHQLFLNMAANEPRWRRYGTRKFPRAPWSAEDDYHWHVQAHLERTLAKRHKIASSRLWALYDEAVHEGWSLDRALPTDKPVPRPNARVVAAAGLLLPAAATAAHAAHAANAASASPARSQPNAAFRAIVVPLRPRQR